MAVALAKARPVPGDLGALEGPKEAKAPVPSPNADDAPELGGFPPEGVTGLKALKGLLLPCDEPSPPYLREAPYARDGLS